jgi:hypothetical protein
METVFAVAPLGVTVSVAVFVPAEVGLNAMLTVQLVFAARLVPQVWVFTYWFELVPPRVMLESVMGNTTLFVTVTV